MSMEDSRGITDEHSNSSSRFLPANDTTPTNSYFISVCVSTSNNIESYGQIIIVVLKLILLMLHQSYPTPNFVNVLKDNLKALSKRKNVPVQLQTQHHGSPNVLNASRLDIPHVAICRALLQLLN